MIGNKTSHLQATILRKSDVEIVSKQTTVETTTCSSDYSYSFNLTISTHLQTKNPSIGTAGVHVPIYSIIQNNSSPTPKTSKIRPPSWQSGGVHISQVAPVLHFDLRPTMERTKLQTHGLAPHGTVRAMGDFREYSFS